MADDNIIDLAKHREKPEQTPTPHKRSTELARLILAVDVMIRKDHNAGLADILLYLQAMDNITEETIAAILDIERIHKGNP